jgi:hypothetical protein
MRMISTGLMEGGSACELSGKKCRTIWRPRKWWGKLAWQTFVKSACNKHCGKEKLVVRLPWPVLWTPRPEQELNSIGTNWILLDSAEFHQEAFFPFNFKAGSATYKWATSRRATRPPGKAGPGSSRRAIYGNPGVAVMPKIGKESQNGPRSFLSIKLGSPRPPL